MEQSQVDVSEQAETQAGVALFRRAQKILRAPDTNDNRMELERLCFDITDARKAGLLSGAHAADLQGYLRHRNRSSFVEGLAEEAGDELVAKPGRGEATENGDTAVAAVTQEARGNWLKRWTGGLLG